jgi:hypothetical protein
MAKVGFEYEYQNVYEVFESLKLESFEYLSLPFIITIFIWTYFLIYKIAPIYFIHKEFKLEQKIKMKKKEFIERIKLQNEIEDEVEKELK